MIITVTLNPAIDKTVEIDAFALGGLNRIEKIIVDAGGKGINVSKTIKALGGESLAMGLLGGINGNVIKNKLEELGIKHDFLMIDEETRVNTKVVEKSGQVTELNERGPVISEKQLSAFWEKLENRVTSEDLVILSGSVPNGVPKDIYKNLVALIHDKGANVFVDADGELFENALEAKPDIIKPNKSELEKLMGRSLTKNEVLDAGKQLLEKGIQTVIISMGSEGAYFLTRTHTLFSPGLDVETHSTVGAGDAMVAAFSYGMQKGLDLREIIKLAMATSAGAVTTKGTKPPTLELVNSLVEKVVLT